MKVMERIRVITSLVLGLMALGLLTWAIGQVYLELVGQTTRAKTEAVHNLSQATNLPKESVLELPGLTFWTCQVGVFQNAQNAQSVQEKLKGLAWDVQVISTHPAVVAIGLGHSAEALKGLRQALLEKEIPTVVKQVVLPQRTFRVTGNSSQLTANLLKNVNSILQEGFSTNLLAQEDQSWVALAANHPPQELAELQQMIRQMQEKTSVENQSSGLSLFTKFETVINQFSGK